MILKKIKNKVFPLKKINIGQIGIFLDQHTFYTKSSDNFQVVADVYYKVKVIGVYEGLVEVEVIDIHTSSRTDECIKNIINNHTLKYIKIKDILWG